MHRILRQALVTVALTAAAVPLLASTAAADQYFHTSHAELIPIGDAPLQSGFVNDIHVQGPQIGAEERYQLNGALPDTTYTVELHIYVGDPTCSTTYRRRVTTTFTTNDAGNGEAGFTFFAANPVPPPKPNPSGIIWVISSGGVPQYQTDCIPVTLGA